MPITTETLLCDAMKNMETNPSLSTLEAVSKACRIDNGQAVLEKYEDWTPEQLFFQPNSESRTAAINATASILGGSISHFHRKLTINEGVNLNFLADLINQSVKDTPLPEVSPEMKSKLNGLGLNEPKALDSLRLLLEHLLEKEYHLEGFYKSPFLSRFNNGGAARLLAFYTAEIWATGISLDVVKTCWSFEETMEALRRGQKLEQLKKRWEFDSNR